MTSKVLRLLLMRSMLRRSSGTQRLPTARPMSLLIALPIQKPSLWVKVKVGVRVMRMLRPL